MLASWVMNELHKKQFYTTGRSGYRKSWHLYVAFTFALFMFRNRTPPFSYRFMHSAVSEELISVSVLSRLDCCNSLCSCLSKEAVSSSDNNNWIITCGWKLKVHWYDNFTSFWKKVSLYTQNWFHSNNCVVTHGSEYTKYPQRNTNLCATNMTTTKNSK